MKKVFNLLDINKLNTFFPKAYLTAVLLTGKFKTTAFTAILYG